MNGTITVAYKDIYDWKTINAHPESYKQAISTLYAIAPFFRARVDIPGQAFRLYEYKNSKVIKIM